MKKFIKEYRVELVAIVVVFVGIFLLVEQFDIRRTILRVLSRFGNSLLSAGQNILGGFAAYFSSFSLSDLIGWILIIMAFAFFIWRTRVRYLKSPYWLAAACPRCESPIRRVHRSYIDKLLGQTLLPHSRRFRCTNPECRWSGLRYHEHQSHSHRSHEEDTTPVHGTQRT